MTRRPPTAKQQPAGRRRVPQSAVQDPLTAALQRYADRGVFRGFRAEPAARGRIEYRFLWLTKQPMSAVFDTRAARLTFPSLLPQVDHEIAADMKAISGARFERGQPEHRRVDARRCRITAAARKGDFSMTVDIRGANHDYAVSKALNIVNEMFVTLHEHHPEYLTRHFGISTE